MEVPLAAGPRLETISAADPLVIDAGNDAVILSASRPVTVRDTSGSTNLDAGKVSTFDGRIIVIAKDEALVYVRAARRFAVP